MVTIFAGNCRRKAGNVSGFALADYDLKASCGNMMAFIHNEIAVFSHNIIYYSLSAQALNCCNIYNAGWLASDR